jgi:hypothetical protein
MKTTCILSGILIVISLSMDAQQPYRTAIGGNLSYSSEKTRGDYLEKTESAFIIAPSIGYMVDEHVSWGLTIGYIHTTFETKEYMNAGIQEETKKLSLIPYFRFQKDLAAKVDYYTEAYGGKIFSLDNDAIEKPLMYNAGIRLGILYHLKNSVSIELQLAQVDYLYESVEPTGIRTRRLAFDYALVKSVIGVKYYF